MQVFVLLLLGVSFFPILPYMYMCQTWQWPYIALCFWACLYMSLYIPLFLPESESFKTRKKKSYKLRIDHSDFDAIRT